jgi:hypothetical protein
VRNCVCPQPRCATSAALPRSTDAGRHATSWSFPTRFSRQGTTTAIRCPTSPADGAMPMGTQGGLPETEPDVPRDRLRAARAFGKRDSRMNLYPNKHYDVSSRLCGCRPDGRAQDPRKGPSGQESKVNFRVWLSASIGDPLNEPPPGGKPLLWGSRRTELLPIQL